MKTFIFAFILSMMSFAAYANHSAYEIEIEFQLSTNQPVHGKITVNEGKKSQIKFDNLTFQFDANEYEENSVDIKTLILERRDGVEVKLAQPRVIVRLGQEAELSRRNDRNHENENFRLKLKVFKHFNDSVE